jgi:hypothetical protein
MKHVKLAGLRAIALALENVNRGCFPFFSPPSSAFTRV